MAAAKNKRRNRSIRAWKPATTAQVALLESLAGEQNRQVPSRLTVAQAIVLIDRWKAAR